MTTFKSLNLPQDLLTKLEEIGFSAPTEIQTKAIPLILDGKNVLASSKTGSGKTGSFIIPIMAKVINEGAKALIIVPTRELAVQIKEFAQQLITNNNVKLCLVFGGSEMRRQVENLKKKPDIIIATPGRLNDHINKKSVNLSNTNIVVLDEFDRMLEIGFKNEIEKIISCTPQQRQTIMLSATTRKTVLDSAKKYMVDYSEIILQSAKEDHSNIEQLFVEMRHPEKYEILKEKLSHYDDITIVFVSTKKMADVLSEKLNDEGFTSDVIHGDLRQRERERAIRNFKSRQYTVLVATDVAARGIDIADVKLIINYDMPNNPEDYTHRIGRTGRASNTGVAISFITPMDRRIHEAITSSKTSDEFEGKKFGPKKKSGSSFGGGSRGPSRGSSFGGSRDGRSFRSSSSRDGSQRRDSYERDDRRDDRRGGGADFEMKPRRDRFEDFGKSRYNNSSENYDKPKRSFDSERPDFKRKSYDKSSEGRSERSDSNSRFGLKKSFRSDDKPRRTFGSRDDGYKSGGFDKKSTFSRKKK